MSAPGTNTSGLKLAGALACGLLPTSLHHSFTQPGIRSNTSSAGDAGSFGAAKVGHQLCNLGMHTKSIKAACRRSSFSTTANLRASAAGSLSRSRRNSANSRAAVRANLLNSRQAASVLMAHTLTGALLVTRSNSQSTLRPLHSLYTTCPLPVS